MTGRGQTQCAEYTHNRRFTPRKLVLADNTKLMDLDVIVGSEIKHLQKKCAFQEASKHIGCRWVAARGWKVEKKYQIMGQSLHWDYEKFRTV